jgi:hypothetical protein
MPGFPGDDGRGEPEGFELFRWLTEGHGFTPVRLAMMWMGWSRLAGFLRPTSTGRPSQRRSSRAASRTRWRKRSHCCGVEVARTASAGPDGPRSAPSGTGCGRPAAVDSHFRPSAPLWPADTPTHRARPRKVGDANPGPARRRPPGVELPGGCPAVTRPAARHPDGVAGVEHLRLCAGQGRGLRGSRRSDWIEQAQSTPTHCFR